MLWLIATVALFQVTLYFPFLINSGWFYVACAACGAPALFIGKLAPVASPILTPALAVAAFIVVGVLRLGYFGL